MYVDASRDFLFFSDRAARAGGGGGGGRFQTFSFSFFPCSADHERDWPPCKVVVFGLATNALNVRNNIVYFVWDSASEFGVMGFTSFLGFSCPNLLLAV